MLEFLNSDVGMVPEGQTTIPYTLLQSPRSQTTVFVGTWRLDTNGFYQKATNYRYVGSKFQPVAPDLQFTISRKTKTLTLNQPMPAIPDQLLGTLSGEAIEYFNLPIYPVANVRKVYVDQGAALGANRYLYATAFTFNKAEGTLRISAVPGSLLGQPVYAVCDPAVAILYEQDGAWKPQIQYELDVVVNVNDVAYRVVTPGLSDSSIPDFADSIDQMTRDNQVEWICEGPSGTRRLLADMNPAYSGISSGYVYLLHSRVEAQTVKLAVDKPRIAVPPVGNGSVGLLAFGPVYSSGDYALLIATAYDSQNNLIPNVQLQVVPGKGFDGLINYQDPTKVPVLARTGGDGTANLIYTPNKNFGQFLPNAVPAGGFPGGIGTTTILHDTLFLNAPVALSQLYNRTEGWLTTLYSITNDIGLYGKVGANEAEGEIPFAVSGTPGAPTYKTNGRLISWLSGGSPVAPIAAYDANGNPTTSPAFSGMVSRLVFGASLPTPANLAAFFFTYIDRISFSLSVIDSNVISNSVLLQIQPPPLIPNDPWLILDDAINGKLDSFRLGWSNQFNTTPSTALVGG